MNYVKVEFDPNYYGGDYNKVGQFAFVPADSVIEEKFEELTNLSRVHIVHYSPDELYDADGNLCH